MSGDESDIFGPPGVCDKINFRGVRGPFLYTEKTTQLGKALMKKNVFFRALPELCSLFHIVYDDRVERASGICFASSQFS